MTTNALGHVIPTGSEWAKEVHDVGVNVEKHDDDTVLVWCSVEHYGAASALRKVERVLRDIGKYWFPSAVLAEGTLRIEGPYAVGRTHRIPKESR